MARSRILVLEDDEEYQLLYEQFFHQHTDEFAWVLAKTGDAAISTLKDDSHSFDVALLDWRLNRSAKGGFHVLQAIRSSAQTQDLVAFMVTSNEHHRDVQAAIETGADDYINKPFEFDALAARLRGRIAQKKRQLPDPRRDYALDGLRLDCATGTVVLNGKRLELWKTEVALLRLFLESPDRVFSADQLWHTVRGYESGTAGKALTIQISNLRKKLGAWGERIETRRGLGYVLHTNLPVS